MRCAEPARHGRGVVQPVEHDTDLPRLVGGTKPGTKSTVTVFRRGSSRDIQVTVVEFEPEVAAKKSGDRGNPSVPAPVSCGLSNAESV